MYGALVVHFVDDFTPTWRDRAGLYRSRLVFDSRRVVAFFAYSRSLSAVRWIKSAGGLFEHR